MYFRRIPALEPFALHLRNPQTCANQHLVALAQEIAVRVVVVVVVVVPGVLVAPALEVLRSGSRALF